MGAQPANETILEFKGVSKDFPGVRALDKVDFDLKKGEVHVLVGENGAGKSTLIKILAGVYPPTEGEIYCQGDKVEIRDPKAAIEYFYGKKIQKRKLLDYDEFVKKYGVW